MKQLLNKFRNSVVEDDAPQVSHRANVLNDAIRKGRRPRPAGTRADSEATADDPRIAYIQERNEIIAGADPYNNNDFDRADSWKNGGDR